MPPRPSASPRRCSRCARSTSQGSRRRRGDKLHPPRPYGGGFIATAYEPKRRGGGGFLLARTLSLRAATLGASPVRTGEDDFTSAAGVRRWEGLPRSGGT